MATKTKPAVAPTRRTERIPQGSFLYARIIPLVLILFAILLVLIVAVAVALILGLVPSR